MTYIYTVTHLYLYIPHSHIYPIVHSNLYQIAIHSSKLSTTRLSFNLNVFKFLSFPFSFPFFSSSNTFYFATTYSNRHKTVFETIQTVAIYQSTQPDWHSFQRQFDFANWRGRKAEGILFFFVCPERQCWWWNWRILLSGKKEKRIEWTMRKCTYFSKRTDSPFLNRMFYRVEWLMAMQVTCHDRGVTVFCLVGLNCRKLIYNVIVAIIHFGTLRRISGPIVRWFKGSL